MRKHRIHAQITEKTFVGFPVELTSNRWLGFEGGALYRPVEYKGNFSSIVEIDGENHVIVTQPLITAYREALGRLRENPEVYRKLEEFVNFMNQVAKEEITVSELPPAGLSELFHLANPTPEMLKELESYTGEQFLKVYARHAGFRMPSILEVKVDDHGWIYKLLGQPTFQVPSYTIEDDGSLNNTTPPLIYVDGEWRMLALKY